MTNKNEGTGITQGLLNEMQRQADPLADAVMARIIGPWPAGPDESRTAQWRAIAAANQQMAQWTDNDSLEGVPMRQDDARVGGALQDYLRSARALPAWADAQKMQRAEQIFLAHGALSCTLLFCASLPQCYVFPALAGVLHTAGQLEAHTEHRIRSTAAMIFPVMMPGGLTQPQGGGIAQILKVRLIHATIRHLILRGNPEDVLRASQLAGPAGDAGMIAPMALPPGAPDMYQAMFARGWNLGRDGLPCNQVELAYTLLTFGYVFLQGLRRLGIGLSRPDEEAYLHAWNVVGHVLGIQADLMAHTMEDGQALFERLQDYGRSAPVAPDPRPALAQALMQAMARVIPWAVARPFPQLMTRYLCGAATARDLGLSGPLPWVSQMLFGFLLLFARAIDTSVRLFVPEFSMSRSLTRVLGYHFMKKILMDQTRPLKLPERVLNQAQTMMTRWRTDPHAPRWLGAIEARLTQEP